ncbi:MAG: flagellin [Alphaproteobacteria bacterium]|nr:flagellin [Alphaproteobacteria bacterium]MDD9919482.1 flagellin [Alphaproteobacteria bacterium]
MVARVATGFQNQTSLSQLQKSNSDIATSTYQITTGYKDNRLLGYSEDAYALLNLYDLQGNTQMYLDNITTAKNRLSATESSLQGMTDLLSEAAQLWTLGRTENSAETRASLAPKAESLAVSYYNLFKTKFDGRYIFSGQNGGETPTTANATATAFPGSPVPTTYYQGDSALQTIVSGPGLTSTYGVAGNETGLANMKAGLEALWYGLSNNDETEIDNAISALESAQSELASLLGDVGGQMNSMTQLEERHNNSQVFLKEQADELDKVDVSEAITEFSQQQATLQASMMVITQLNRLSLLDFL